jgi:hypothetical protein
MAKACSNCINTRIRANDRYCAQCGYPIPIDTSSTVVNKSVSIKADPPTALTVVRGGWGKYHGSNVLAWPKVEDKNNDDASRT